MILYFSGTGNSKYSAQMLSDILCDDITDISVYLRQNKSASLHSDKPWVFVCPIYAWKIPHVVSDFIQKSKFSGSNSAYFVLTCGADAGNAQDEIIDLCSKTGLLYKGFAPLVMPDNCIVLFPSPTEKEISQKIGAISSQIEKIAHKIKQNEKFDIQKISIADKFKSGPINFGMYRFFINPKKFYATNECISCGICENVCPLANIKLENGKPVWHENCTLCMACICSCPKTAIEYGKLSHGKARYLCPQYHKES